MTETLTAVADLLCGYPLFLLLIGGGMILLIGSGCLPLRRLPDAIAMLRERHPTAGSDQNQQGQISSVKALASVVAATVGMGNIAGVAIALVMGGPGAIFWMWVSALVGMASKYHEGVLAIAYREVLPDGTTRGGPMYIIRRALHPKWWWMAGCFAVAGMIGTLCIMNANQLTEATIAAAGLPVDNLGARLAVGTVIASIVAAVVLGGIRRIATVASVMVPVMVGFYFLMVAYVLFARFELVPEAIISIFREAFSLRAGWGALIGVALIGARRAMLVNDAGVGTASIMHGESRGTTPDREGLIAMLGPAIDSGFVCTLTALALMVSVDFDSVDRAGLQGLSLAMDGFGSVIPGGHLMLMAVVACFALSSMFSYSFYGNRCAVYLFGPRGAKVYTWFFIMSLILFAAVPLSAAVALCDMFYFFMAFPTMITLLVLRKKVRALAGEKTAVAAR
ncbi:MAG: alanine:cation symporter family protein [Bacteroides sp.]|nr:alanine:cation symporter family protein [Bacteroides sp.]